MLRQPQNARRFNERISLTLSDVSVDEFGHASVNSTKEVATVYAYVRQMSATKTMLTFQQADIVGIEVEFRAVEVAFDGILWRGHQLHFAQPENVDNRGRYVKLTGWYHIDNPIAK